MDDVKARDRALYRRELWKVTAEEGLADLALTIFAGIVLWSLWSMWPYVFPALGGWAFVRHLSAKRRAHAKRFHDPRYREIWEACVDRVGRLQGEIKAGRGKAFSVWEELPDAVERTAHELYVALRRADVLAHEVGRSEQGLFESPHRLRTGDDPQSDALLMLAERNRAEYTGALSAILAQVRRTEAQAEVFVTTLDALRARVLSLRVRSGPRPLSSEVVLGELAEARLQIQAIDTALEELDMSHFPKTITIERGRA